MTLHKVMKIVSFVLALASATTPGLAQTPATNGAQASGDGSAAAMAQEAANPFASSWLMQTQQNNNWLDMPGSDGTRVQSNLLFQPLMNVRLTNKLPLFIRPMVTMVNSVPQLKHSGDDERTSGFGDTVLAFVIPRPLLGGRLTLGAGPTFIFPTASEGQLGQDTWQLGPDAGAVLLGRRFISYAFVQQWFKIGGGGRTTNQMNAVFNYTYMFENGWTIGTQPNLSVDWEARQDEGATLSIGPQVGKLCKCGSTPTLFQVQLQYFAIHPDVVRPRWNIQLQVTPTIPALLKKKLF